MNLTDVLYDGIENFFIAMGVLTLFGLIALIIILHTRIKNDLHENDESKK